MSNWFDPGNGNFIAVDGCLVERDALYITEKLMDYDPDLRVMCIDPDNPNVTFADAPFVVVKLMPNGTMQRVLEAWQLDDTVVQRVYMADGQRNNQLDQLIKLEQQKKAEKERADKEVMGHNHQIFQGALANEKSEYTFKKDDKLVTVSDTHGVKYDKGKKSYS